MQSRNKSSSRRSSDTELVILECVSTLVGAVYSPARDSAFSAVPGAAALRLGLRLSPSWAPTKISSRLHGEWLALSPSGSLWQDVSDRDIVTSKRRRFGDLAPFVRYRARVIFQSYLRFRSSLSAIVFAPCHASVRSLCASMFMFCHDWKLRVIVIIGGRRLCCLCTYF